MSKKLFSIVAVFMTILFASIIYAQQPEYLPLKPMFQATNVTAQQARVSGSIPYPDITWGGDVNATYAEKFGLFKAEGLNLKLFCENDFLKQVEDCLSGKTPYLRGTMDMINAAAELFEKNNIKLVVIHQYTWSTGGDAMVVRPGKNLSNIKKIGLQLYGPHMYYAAKLITDAGRNPNEIEFKWLKHLDSNYPESGKRIMDPPAAFIKDPTMDAVMCIIPDANNLTSGGKVGDGGAGTVKGAKILVTTKTAGTIISDVIAVREDWLMANEANKEHARKVVHALLKAEEGLRDLIKNKASRQAEFQGLMSESAALLLGTSAMSADMEGMLGDCQFVGYNGNVSFFTGVGTTRNFSNITSEIQNAFIKMGLMTKRVSLEQANWDYASLATDLKYAKVAPSAPRFDEKKVAREIEQKIAAEAEWSEGLFNTTILFAVNQTDFTEEKYAPQFEEALRKAQTYNGALLTIEGYTDPYGLQKAKEKGDPQPILNQMIAVAKKTSVDRANKVKDSFLTFCKKRGYIIDMSSIYVTGLGYANAKFPTVSSKEQSDQNRRVVFSIREVSAEVEFGK